MHSCIAFSAGGCRFRRAPFIVIGGGVAALAQVCSVHGASGALSIGVVTIAATAAVATFNASSGAARGGGAGCTPPPQRAVARNLSIARGAAGTSSARTYLADAHHHGPAIVAMATATAAISRVGWAQCSATPSASCGAMRSTAQLPALPAPHLSRMLLGMGSLYRS